MLPRVAREKEDEEMRERGRDIVLPNTAKKVVAVPSLMWRITNVLQGVRGPVSYWGIIKGHRVVLLPAPAAVVPHDPDKCFHCAVMRF